MSAQPIQRYNDDSMQSRMIPDAAGLYVLHSDLAAVEAERDALAQRLAHVEGILKRVPIRCRFDCAFEQDRLPCDCGAHDIQLAITVFLAAAKEGKAG